MKTFLQYITEQIEQTNESFLDSPLDFAQGPYIKKKRDKMHSVGGARNPSTFTGMGRRSSLPYTNMPNIMSKPEGRVLSQRVNDHFNEIRGYIGHISGGKADEFQDHVYDGVFSGHDNDTIINNHGPLNNHGMKTDSDDYTDDVHNYIDAVRDHHEYKTDVRDDSEKFYMGEAANEPVESDADGDLDWEFVPEYPYPGPQRFPWPIPLKPGDPGYVEPQIPPGWENPYSVPVPIPFPGQPLGSPGFFQPMVNPNYDPPPPPARVPGPPIGPTPTRPTPFLYPGGVYAPGRRKTYPPTPDPFPRYFRY